MCSLETFKIDLKALNCEEKVFEFKLNDDFFRAIAEPDVSHGCLHTTLTVRKVSTFFELYFHTEGKILIPCDLCLDDMEQAIHTDNRLVAKFGEEYSEDDDLVTLAEEEGILDVSWFIYEFIVLDIPIKHVHEPGKCNSAMIETLEALSATRSSEENGEDSVDPRWGKLKELKF